MIKLEELQNISKDELINIIDGYVSDQEIWLSKVDSLQKENEGLKAEIKRLTEWKDKLQDTKDELEQQIIDTGFKEYCEENKRLTDENAELQRQVDELKEKIMNLKDRVAGKSYDSLLTTPDDVEEIFGDAYESEFNKFLEQAVKATVKKFADLVEFHSISHISNGVENFTISALGLKEILTEEFGFKYSELDDGVEVE